MINVRNTLVPFAPEVNAVHCVNRDQELYIIGATKRPSKAGRTFLTFNVLFVIGPARLLVPGFRLVGGKIFPPQARLFRQTFDHFHAGVGLRELLYEGVKSIKEDIPLLDFEAATKPLELTADLIKRYNTKGAVEQEKTVL